MKQENAKILSNTREAPGYYRICLGCGPDYAKAHPGQFVSLRFQEGISPLLRRPFSIHRLIYEHGKVTGIEILYKTIGAFTHKLSHAASGEQLDLLGPLGHGFTVSPKYAKNALVAGGIGVAPFVFLADRLAEEKIPVSHSTVFIGGRSSADILCKSVFQSLGMDLQTATEDGTEGEKGMVTQALTRWLKDHQPDMIYACGPTPMLRAVANIAQGENIPCEISVETIMACGFGVCLGCVVQTTDGLKYRHACKDGPVFDAKTIIL